MNISGKKIADRRNLLGLTLEHLSNRMAGAGSPVSVSTLYRMEAGIWRWIPDNTFIDTIADELGLDKDALKQSFEEDRKEKAKAKTRTRLEIQLLLTDGVEFSRRIRTTIREARAGGDVEYALETANWLDAALHRIVSKSRITEVARDALTIERAYVLAEKVNIFGDTLPRQEMGQALHPILREGRRLQSLIADEKLENELKALNYTVVQGLYYMKGNHARALRFRVPESDIIHDPYWKLALHRVTATNLAYVNENKKALREKVEVQNMLDNGIITDPFTILWAMDVMGRVHASIKDPDSLEQFDQAWSYYDEIKKEHGRSRLREAQLAMDNLRAILYVDPANIGLAEHLARKGQIAATSQTGETPIYPRHVERIDQLISDVYEWNRRQVN